MRLRGQQVRERISIDLNIQFGQPCVASRRITTAVLRDRAEAGELIADIAADYDIDTYDVLAALEYEYWWLGDT